MVEPSSQEAARLDAALDAALDPVLRGVCAAPQPEVALLRLGSEDDGEVEPIEEVELDADVLADGDVETDADVSQLQLETPTHSDNIRVFVRVRPPIAREGSAPCRDIVRVDVPANTVSLLAEPPRFFTFDGVLAESSVQDEVFELVGTSVGEACLGGYNGSIYVYGQTGSGKTYTMQGPVVSVNSMHNDERRGIMCRILDLIFTEVGRRHREGGSVEYRCRCSYVEIYKEQIADLLEPGPMSTNLQVREDINRGIYVERLSEHTVWTVSDAFHVLLKGLHQRHVGATHMNELSSRSHAVFTLVLEATSTTTGGVTSTRTSRLNLIDLAGSERQCFDPHNPTMHESLRVKEAGAINRSLSALTNVIMSLSRAGQRRRSSAGGPGAGQRRPFVRYRDSKLTFLLRDSLGGNSKTVIVANVSPSALCFGETLSTLKFAARAKHIRCAAIRNEEYSGTVESLMLEVKSLKQQLELLSSRGLIPGDIGTLSQASLAGHGPRSAVGAGPGVGDDADHPVEGLIAGGNEDLRRLYGPRRVRRLEILLAAALERERRCELRRHKLDKFTQYLNGLLEHKERYFDAVRDYFAFLVKRASANVCFPMDVVPQLIGFRQQLCRVPTDSRGLTPDVLSGDAEESWAPVVDTTVLESPDRQSTAAGENSSLSDLWGLGSPQGRPGVGATLCDSPRASPHSRSYGSITGEVARRGGACRGASQSLQQRSPSGRLSRGLGPTDGPGSQTTSSTLLSSPGKDGVCDSLLLGERGTGGEEIIGLRAENRLLRRQLENHPELYRLSVENRLLREHLASLVQQHALAREEPPYPKGHHHARRALIGGKGRVAEKEDGGGGLTRERSLTRTSRSSIIGVGECRGSEVATLTPQKMTLGEAMGQGGPQELCSPSPAGLGDAPSGTFEFQAFPGIQGATQITPSSSSVDSDDGDSEGRAAEASLGISAAVAGVEAGSDGSGQAAAIPARPSGARGALGNRGGPAAGSDSTADATSFLPTLAREVEELLRAKGGLEDNLKQLMRGGGAASAGAGGGECNPLSSPGGPPGTSQHDLSQMSMGTSSAATLGSVVEPRMAAEILRSSSEVLRFAEGMLAKGKGDTLLLRAGGGQESDGTDNMPGYGARGVEGLDERDVFLSLMKSLPSEGPLLSRQGLACSAPHLTQMRHSGESSGGAGAHDSSIAAQAMRLSSSTGHACGRLMRNRSTMQLHRIAEQPPSPGSAGFQAPFDPLYQQRRDVTAPAHSPPTITGSGSNGNSGEMLREAAQKVRQLCHHLELVGDAYRDMREQFGPLQEEYFRRLDECRFLEAQCRRLDVHCRLLEERAQAIKDSSPSRLQLLTSVASSAGMQSHFAMLTGGQLNPAWKVIADSPKTPGSSTSLSATSPETPRNSPVVQKMPPLPTLLPSPLPFPSSCPLGVSEPVTATTMSTAPGALASGALGHDTSRPEAFGTDADGTAPGGGPPAAAAIAVPGGALGTLPSSQRSQSAATLGPMGSAWVTGIPEVPPRGLLYAASISELRGMDGQHHSGAVNPPRSAASGPWRHEDYIRRVSSAPLLPVVQSAPQFMAPPHESSASATTLSGAGGQGIAFSSSKFLSLARQPGTKTAALQYLMSHSTRNALASIGESFDAYQQPKHESVALQGTQLVPTKPADSPPARSASVGRLGGVASVVGLAGPRVEGVSSLVTQPAAMMQSASKETLGVSLGGIPVPRQAVGSPPVYGGTGSSSSGPAHTVAAGPGSTGFAHYRPSLGKSSSVVSMSRTDFGRDRAQQLQHLDLGDPVIGTGGAVGSGDQSQAHAGRHTCFTQNAVGFPARPVHVSTHGASAGSLGIASTGVPAAPAQLQGRHGMAQAPGQQMPSTFAPPRRDDSAGRVGGLHRGAA